MAKSKYDQAWEAFEKLLLAAPPHELREWILFQRSLRPPGSWLWTVKLTVGDGPKVVAVVVALSAADAVRGARELIGADSPFAIVTRRDVLNHGLADSPESDRDALDHLKRCKAKGYELWGHLSVIGGEVLRDDAQRHGDEGDAS